MRLSDLDRWIDPETGLITAADGGVDNLATCTATALQFLGAEDRLTLRSRVIEFFRLCEVKPGLYSRRPGDHGTGSVDNLVGMACLSYQLDTDHRYKMLKYADANDWVFDVENPGSSSVRNNYGRFAGIPPFLKIAAGVGAPLYDQVIMAGATVFNAGSARENTSDKCLQILINSVVSGRYTICSLGIGVWKTWMQKKYPRGQRELYEIYWGVAHPFTLESPTLF